MYVVLLVSCLVPKHQLQWNRATSGRCSLLLMQFYLSLRKQNLCCSLYYFLHYLQIVSLYTMSLQSLCSLQLSIKLHSLFCSAPCRILKQLLSLHHNTLFVYPDAGCSRFCQVATCFEFGALSGHWALCAEMGKKISEIKPEPHPDMLK